MGYSKVSHIISMYLVSFPKFLLLISECLCFETRYCYVSQLTSNSQSPCFILQSVWDYNHVLPCLTFVRGIMLSSQNEESSNFSPCPSFLGLFSIQIAGFSIASSGQLVTGSAPIQGITLLDDLRSVRTWSKYPTTISSLGYHEPRPWRIMLFVCLPWLKVGHTLFMHCPPS